MDTSGPAQLLAAAAGDPDADAGTPGTESDVPGSDHTQDQMQALATKHTTKAEALMQQEEWAKAAQEFSYALKYVVKRNEHAHLLCQRSAALCSFSAQLRSIPAAASERRALFAHDPDHIAALALKDARRAAQLRPAWAPVYVNQGRALALLERYGEAEGAYLEGLLLAPGDTGLMTGLEQVRGVLAEQAQERRQALAAAGGHPAEQQDEEEEAAEEAAAAAGSVGAEEGDAFAGGGGHQDQDGVGSPPQGPGGGSSSGRLGRAGSGSISQKRQRRASTAVEVDDVECILCMKLLYEPVTTPCGHTFCKACFGRAMDHAAKCPMCRTVLHVARELPVSITLHNIIRHAHPAEYAERAEETAAAALADATAAAQRLPLFVMSAMIPGEKMALNIFEPRYRLMVRRCMEGSRRFGMAQVGVGQQVEPAACEVEILECDPQPDGRYYLEIVGRQRITVNSTWEQDGYRVASVTPLTDTPPPAGSEEATRLTSVVAQVAQQSNALVERLRAVLSSRRGGAERMRALLERVGSQPSAAADPESFSWWVGRLLLMVGADAEGPLRRDLLAAPDTLSRLEYELRQLGTRLEATASCAIM